MMNKEKQYLQRQNFRLHWAHWLVIGLSLFLTIFAWSFSKSQNEEKVRMYFDREVERVVELVHERMVKYEDALWSGVSMINTLEGEINGEQWLDFATSLSIEKKYPGINGIGVIYQKSPGEIQSFLTEKEAEMPGFQVYPEHQRNDFWPITYIEPLATNLKARGLDMAHENNRYQAAMKAKETKTAQITGPIILVQDKEQTPGFLFYAPFYKDKKKENFIGLVYAPFIFKKLIEGTLRQESRHVGISIEDNQSMLYNEHMDSHQDFDPNPVFKEKVELNFYGRTWVFDIWTTKSFRQQTENNQPTLILVGGIFIDILIFFLFWLMSNLNRKANKYAEEMFQEAEAHRGVSVNSSKLAALGEMAGGIAHEINNPLMVILGSAQRIKRTLSKSGKIEPKVNESIEMISSTVNRISKIINGLKNLARDGVGDEKEMASVKEIISDSIILCNEKFKKNHIEFSTPNLESLDLVINCRRVEISQVLLNLLNNAFHAVKKQEKPFIRLEVERDQDFVSFKIVDSGEGISPENQQKIMDPFFTTKPVGEGTGLGLSISRSIVEGHGGRLFLEPKAKNTTFVVALPMAEKLPKTA